MNEVGLPWPPLECTLSLASCRLRAESLARRLHCRFWAPTGAAYPAGLQAAAASNTDPGERPKPNGVKGYSIHGLVNGHWCSPPNKKNVYWDQAYDPLDGSDSEEIEDEGLEVVVNPVIQPPGRVVKDTIFRPPGEHRIASEGMGSVLLRKKHIPSDLQDEQERLADSDSEHGEYEDECSGRLYRGYSYEQGLDKIGLTNGDEVFERKLQESESDSDEDEFVSAREPCANGQEQGSTSNKDQTDHISNGLKYVSRQEGARSDYRTTNGVIVEEDEDDVLSEESYAFHVSNGDLNKEEHSDNDTGIGSNLTNGTQRLSEHEHASVLCSGDTSVSAADVTLTKDDENTENIGHASSFSEDEGVESEEGDIEKVNCQNDKCQTGKNNHYKKNTGVCKRDSNNENSSDTDGDSTGYEIADFEKEWDTDVIKKKAGTVSDDSDTDNECADYSFQTGDPVASGTNFTPGNQTVCEGESLEPSGNSVDCKNEVQKLSGQDYFTNHWTRPVVFGKRFNNEEAESDSSESDSDHQSNSQNALENLGTVNFGLKMYRDDEVSEDEVSTDEEENDTPELKFIEKDKYLNEPVLFGRKVNSDDEDEEETEELNEKVINEGLSSTMEPVVNSESEEDSEEEIENKSTETINPIASGQVAVMFGQRVDTDSEGDTEEENENENSFKINGKVERVIEPLLFGTKFNLDSEDETEEEEDGDNEEEKDKTEVKRNSTEVPGESGTIAESVIFRPKINNDSEEEEEEEEEDEKEEVGVQEKDNEEINENCYMAVTVGAIEKYTEPAIFGTRFSQDFEDFRESDEDENRNETQELHENRDKFPEEILEKDEVNVKAPVLLGRRLSQNFDDEEEDLDLNSVPSISDENSLKEQNDDFCNTRSTSPVVLGRRLSQKFDDEEEDLDLNSVPSFSDENVRNEGNIDFCDIRDKSPIVLGRRLSQNFDEEEEDLDLNCVPNFSDEVSKMEPNEEPCIIRDKSPVVLGRRLSQNFDDDEDDWHKQLLSDTDERVQRPEDESEKDKNEEDDFNAVAVQPLSGSVIFGSKFYNEWDDDEEGVDLSALLLKDLGEDEEEDDDMVKLVETGSSVFCPVKFSKRLEEIPGVFGDETQDNDQSDSASLQPDVIINSRFKFQVTPVSEQDHLDSLQCDSNDWLQIREDLSRSSSLNSQKDLDEDEDEDDRYRPILWRSTSLKTGKTPPGTPRRKKIVRFADALGLDLEAVRHIVTDDIPIVPASAFMDLKLEAQAPSPSITVPVLFSARKCLCPQFSQPGCEPTFLDRVKTQKVCLENIIVSTMDVMGVVRVLNCSFHKSVSVRYTIDEWRSHHDQPAAYVQGSSDGYSDRFQFTLQLPGLRAGDRIVFAVRYVAGEHEYWDNNRGVDYVLRCMTVSRLNDESDPSDEGVFSFV